MRSIHSLSKAWVLEHLRSLCPTCPKSHSNSLWSADIRRVNGFSRIPVRLLPGAKGCSGTFRGSGLAFRLSFLTAQLLRCSFRSRKALAAENLFLRKQLALFQEREKRARPTTAADRFVFSKLACFFDWRSALVIVKPATLIGWHRAAFRKFWRLKSRPVGRPQVSAEVKGLIHRMAAENPTWGEERIADELLLKLQIRLSPRTVGKYVKRLPRPSGSNDQRWSTFLRNHSREIVACDFFVSVTARFRILYVFIAIEIGSRRLVHFNVTQHPTAEWTVQQLREALPGDQDYRYLLHDRHKTFSADLDYEVESWGIQVMRSPVRMPTANAHCERLIEPYVVNVWTFLFH
jgi:putative transposase